MGQPLVIIELKARKFPSPFFFNAQNAQKGEKALKAIQLPRWATLARCASARLIQVMLPSGTPCHLHLKEGRSLFAIKQTQLLVRAKCLLALLALVAFNCRCPLLPF